MIRVTRWSALSLSTRYLLTPLLLIVGASPLPGQAPLPNVPACPSPRPPTLHTGGWRAGEEPRGDRPSTLVARDAPEALCARGIPVGLEPGRLGRWGADESGISPGRAFLYSALLPGAGQWKLDQDRWAPYAAVELWGWVQFFLRRDEGADLRQQYRDLAWNVARRVSVGSRVDGDFGYYESLTMFEASGAFDGDPLTAGIQPETDVDTFNGSVWQLAGDIFFPADSAQPPPPGSPAYEQALDYYLERAVQPRFAWSWGDSTLQREVFAELIEESDAEFRRSTSMIGLILANHFVSGVDAFLSARLRSMGRDPDSIRLLPLSAPALGVWGLGVSVRP